VVATAVMSFAVVLAAVVTLAVMLTLVAFTVMLAAVVSFALRSAALARFAPGVGVVRAVFGVVVSAPTGGREEGETEREEQRGGLHAAGCSPRDRAAQRRA
jgi:hypothetical protein